MSRCYRISLKESITKTVTASDEMQHQVELEQGILSEEDMKRILKDVLKEEGWTQAEEGQYVLDSDDDEHLVWDVEEGTVTASIEQDKAFEKEVVVTGAGENDASAKANAKKRLEAQKKRVDVEAEEVQRRLRRKITAKLEKNEENRKRKLNRVISKTYKKALKEKAGLLGSIQSIDESQNGDDHSMTIRVLA